MPLSELEQPCPMCGEPLQRESEICAYCGEPTALFKTSNTTEADLDLLRRFRKHIGQLASIWLICGTGFIAVGVLGSCALFIIGMFSGSPDSYLPVILQLVAGSGLGVLMLAIGTGTRDNKRWALYLGLMLSIGFAVVVVMYSPSRIGLIVISVIALFRTYLAVHMEKKLRSLDISLDTKL